MKANSYKILLECVENGVRAGWHRAHKHTDKPTPEQVWDALEQAVMLEIAEYFMFEELA